MAGQDETLPTAAINPALERAQRIERAFNHVARAIELDLADVALSGDELDKDSEKELREIGAVLLRVSQLGINTANSVASIFGETTPRIEESSPLQTPVRISESTHEAATASETLAPDDIPAASEPAPVQMLTPATTKSTSLRPEVVKPSFATPEKKQFDGELYARIVSEKQTPIMELREGMEPIPVRIITDDTIVLNGEKIVLDGDQLFIFNALMKLRDEIVSAKDLRALGFRLEGSSSASQVFGKTMNELTQSIEQATGSTGVNIIKKIGKAAGTKYAVNPAVVLHDERLENTSSFSRDAEIIKKN